MEIDQIREVLVIFLRKLSHHEEHDHVREHADTLLAQLTAGSLDGLCEAIAHELALTRGQPRGPDRA